MATQALMGPEDPRWAWFSALLFGGVLKTSYSPCWTGRWCLSYLRIDTQTHNTQHRRDETDIHLLVTYIPALRCYIPRRRRLHLGGSEPAGLWEGLCSNKTVAHPWFPREDMTDMFRPCRAGRVVKPSQLRTRWCTATPTNGDTSPRGSLSGWMGATSGEVGERVVRPVEPSEAQSH